VEKNDTVSRKQIPVPPRTSVVHENLDKGTKICIHGLIKAAPERRIYIFVRCQYKVNPKQTPSGSRDPPAPPASPECTKCLGNIFGENQHRRRNQQ